MSKPKTPTTTLELIDSLEFELDQLKQEQEDCHDPRALPVAPESERSIKDLIEEVERLRGL